MEKLTQYASHQRKQYDELARELDSAKRAVAPNYDASKEYAKRIAALTMEEYRLRRSGDAAPAEAASLRMLDFGCGTGRVMEAFASHGVRRIDGVDISSNMLDHCRAETAHLQLDGNLFLSNGQDCGKAESEAYDIVYSLLCLHHVPMRQTRLAILASMARCLKPDGMVFVGLKIFPGATDARIPRQHAAWRENMVAKLSNSRHDVMVTPDSLGEVYLDFRLNFSDICIRDVDSRSDEAAYFEYDENATYPYRFNDFYVSASRRPQLAKRIYAPVA